MTWIHTAHQSLKCRQHILLVHLIKRIRENIQRIAVKINSYKKDSDTTGNTWSILEFQIYQKIITIFSQINPFHLHWQQPLYNLKKHLRRLRTINNLSSHPQILFNIQCLRNTPIFKRRAFSNHFLSKTWQLTNLRTLMEFFTLRSFPIYYMKTLSFRNNSNNITNKR